jgi:glycerol-3-phosphate dehydrogenase
MGRCQGGFCLPTVMNIVSEETGLAMTAITKKGNNSNIVVEETKQAGK